MNLKKSRFSFVIITVVAFATTGCGNTNFIKSLVGDTRPTSTTVSEMQTELKRSNNSGNYSAAIPIAKAIISSNKSTPVQKIAAYKEQGVSFLGQAGFNSVEVASQLVDAAKSLDSNIIKSYPKIPVESAKSAAESLNQAAALSSANSTALDKGAQLTRGLANTSVIVSKVNEVFDIANDGTPTLKNVTSNKAALSQLLAKDTADKTILDYSDNARDGLYKSDTLSNDQKSEIDKVQDIPKELNSLNNVVKTGGAGTYTYQNESNQTVVVTPSSSEAVVNAAITHIFKRAN